MNPKIDIKLTYEELQEKGFVCNDIKEFIEFLINETGNELEECGLYNPKAPDPVIYVKHQMDYEKVTKYIDDSESLCDTRIKTKKINRVFCKNDEHFSAEVIYDWKSKNDL